MKQDGQIKYRAGCLQKSKTWQNVKQIKTTGIVEEMKGRELETENSVQNKD
jgi:hypothetical protein